MGPVRRVCAAAAALAVCVGAAVPAQAASVTAYTVSGTRILHPPPYPDDLLPGVFAGDTVVRVDYPAAVFGMDRSIAVAASGLASAVDAAAGTGPVVVAGFSQGAIAVGYEKRRLMALPATERPAPGQLSFVTVGDPTGPGGIMRFLPFPVPILGLTPITVPDTPYDSVIVNGEYDGWGDFPDRPWNLVSLANALLGIVYVHGRYETVPGGLDLAAVPPQNVTVTTNSLGGTTTSYLIPTEKLPLVQPLRDIGVPEPIVTALETPLKGIVDAGYARNDAKPAAVQFNPRSAAAAKAAAPVAQAAVRAQVRVVSAAVSAPRQTRSAASVPAPRRVVAARSADAA